MALAVGSFTQFASNLSDNFWEPYFMAVSETPLNGLVMVAFPTIYVSPTVGGLQAVALKLDGAGGVDVGAEKRIDDCSDNKPAVSIDVSGLKTDGTMGAVYFIDDSGINQGRTITVNTSTLALTVGSPTTVPADSGNQDQHSIDRISDTTLFAAHNKWVSGGGRVNCYKFTEAAGSISASAALTLDSDSEANNRLYVVVLSSSRAFVLWDTDLGDAKVALIDISGATPTLVDGPDTIESTAIIGTPSTANLPRAVKVSSTRTVCHYLVGATYKMVTIDNSSDTIVVNTPLTLTSASGSLTIGRQNEDGCIISYNVGGPLCKIETIAIATDGTLTETADVVTLTPPAAAFRECQIALAQIVGTTVSWIVVAQDTSDDMWAAEVTDELPAEETDPSGGSLNRSWLGRAMPRTNRHRPRPLFGLRRRF